MKLPISSPGSATMWLHMGAFGPRRAGLLTAASPRLKLVDSGESLLDKTDLVFIDAMGTGYSHAVCKATEKDFYGVDEDVDSVEIFPCWRGAACGIDKDRR